MAELNDRTVRESSLNTLRKMMDAPRKKTERKKNLNKLISVLIKELKQDLAEDDRNEALLCLVEEPRSQSIKKTLVSGEIHT